MINSKNSSISGNSPDNWAVAAGYQGESEFRVALKFPRTPRGSSNPNPSEESSVHSESPSHFIRDDREGSGDAGDSGMNVKVSSSEARKLLRVTSNRGGIAVAGAPRLVKMNGKTVYLVPIEMNGKTVGEIYIDPITGKNLGGAGGAP